MAWWPFGRKKDEDPAWDPWDGPWSIGQSIDEGRPLFVRLNTGARALRGKPPLGYEVGVAVPLREPRDDGLPTSEEPRDLLHLEEILVPALEEGRKTIFVAALTGGNVREFILYSSDPEHAKAASAPAESRIATLAIQLIIREDPGWTVYDEWSF